MKGYTNNLKGRPKGTPNKVTTDLRQWITAFIDDNRDQIKNDWLQLEPKDRIQLFEKLLKYALPTLQATDLKMGFERMPDEQLNEIVNQLLETNEA